MKYARLKSIDGSGTIMRYFDLAEGELAKENDFYEIVSGKAKKIAEGSKPTGTILGFSHGGDKLVKGKILLDINPAIVYRALIENAEALPIVGDVVDGFKKVIDVHEHDLTYEFVVMHPAVESAEFTIS